MLRLFLPAFLLVGCVKPAFVIPDAPILPSSVRPPSVPAAVAVPTSIITPVEVDEVRAANLESLTSRRLAILPIGVDGTAEAPLGAATATMIEERLPRVLLESGFSHFIGPDVLMQVPAEKQATRDGTVRWSAPLATLMQVEPIGAADLILAIEVRRAVPVTVDMPVEYRIDDEQAAAYRAKHAKWSDQAEAEQQSLLALRERYEGEWNKAAKTYEDRRGKYGGEPDDPTAGDLARSERAAVIGRIDRILQLVAEDQERTPTPDALAAEVAARSETQAVPAFALKVRARLIDAHSLQVRWLADLSTQDTHAADATKRVLDAVVAGLDN